MMKICIVSVFNSSNPGSYQQLKELGKAYSQYGDVCYLDCKAKRVFEGTFIYTLRCLLKFRFGKAVYELKKRILFFKRYRTLKTITMKDISTVDLFVFGSDEIWNLKRQNMRHPCFYGGGISGKKVSYAPSTGNSDISDFNNHPSFASLLNDLDMISVRDPYSYDVISHICTEKQIPVLLDPTFLKSKEGYNSDCTYDYGKGYVALYCFQGFLNKYNECSSSFLKFAQNKGLRLLSCGVWSDYAENSHPYSSNAFDFYLNADYVITNTYHGTAFAINFNKQFITFSCGRNKISELLRQFGLEDRDCSSKSEEEIMRILDTPIDYSSINDDLEQMRKASFEYIKRSVDMSDPSEIQVQSELD